jgi:hypothetical protein
MPTLPNVPGKDLREYLASRLVKEVEEIMLQERMLDPVR